MKDADVSSFTAAGQWPWKLIQRASECVVDGEIRPVHLQLSPTNKCDYGKCPWCSCSGVDRSQELDIQHDIKPLLRYFHELGTKAVTITGGGEPTTHPCLKDTLEYACRLGIEVGLVTNGVSWGREGVDLQWANEMLTWLRVSTVDPSGEPRSDRVVNICRSLPDVDVGVSFTVPKDVNLAAAQAICTVVEETPNLTHVRFVDDILDPSAEAMRMVILGCRYITKKAIFQPRFEFTAGMNPCLISKLKPYVDASGYVYPCCGVQYTLLDEVRCMPERTRMCHWSEFQRTAAFDGSICQKCYYEKYNVALLNMTEKLRHERFV